MPLFETMAIARAHFITDVVEFICAIVGGDMPNTSRSANAGQL
jgi:hypothetical protein